MLETYWHEHAQEGEGVLLTYVLVPWLLPKHMESPTTDYLPRKTTIPQSSPLLSVMQKVTNAVFGIYISKIWMTRSHSYFRVFKQDT